MAVSHGSRKLQTYRSLYHLNRAFTSISRHIGILEQCGLVRAHQMHVFSGLVRELQSRISHHVVDGMHGVEDKEMFEHSKVRISWEHYLNPDRPAFAPRQSNLNATPEPHQQAPSIPQK